MWISYGRCTIRLLYCLSTLPHDRAKTALRIFRVVRSAEKTEDAQEDQCGRHLTRRLQEIEKLVPTEKRQILEIIDTFIERLQLKRKVGNKQPA